jgi:hypothetical protein
MYGSPATAHVIRNTEPNSGASGYMTQSTT